MKNFSTFSRSVTLLAALLSSVAPVAVLANPVDGNVTAGSASIASTGSTLTVHQSSDKAVIDWRGFDIGAGETTNFVQPSSHALTLNRVGSGGASQINGTINANGNIVIVNPNGVVFGAGAHVDVNGLVATTANISNANAMAGMLKFDQAGNANATIENHGTITAKDAGLVGLVAPNVINSGVITARLGRIHLAAGDTATVDLYGDGLIEVKASDALVQALVENTGTLSAQGGIIAMTAAAGRETVDSLVHVGGTLDARGIGTKDGRIFIYTENPKTATISAHAGRIVIDGKLDVSNATGKGGRVEVAGNKITLASSAVIIADGATGGGTVLIGADAEGAAILAPATLGELQGPALPTADQIILQAGSSITANALSNGDGGEVIVYADKRTDFGGSITANGAGDQGSGGYVETSGRVALLIHDGIVSATGRRRNGVWLLDPADITITGADANSTNTGNVFTATSTGSTVAAATIKSILDGGTNVTIQTSNDGFAGNGDIIVGSAISTTGSGSLTLNAYRDINVNAGITLQSGALNLNANRNVTISSAIQLAGGALTVNANTAGTGNITTAAAINTGAGNIIFTSDTFTGLAGSTITTTGTILLQPYSAGTSIGLGGGAGTLNLDDTELGYFATGASSLTVGNATAGDIAIITWNFAAKSFNVTVEGNDINVGGVTFGLGNFLAIAHDIGGDLGDITLSAASSNTGTTNAVRIFELRSDHDIYGLTGANIAQGGNNYNNIIFNADRNANLDGAISIIGSTYTGSGGIRLGGGSGTISANVGYAYGNATNLSGVSIQNSALTANSSSFGLVINGHGAVTSTVDNNHGVVLTNSSLFNYTSNWLQVYGVAGGSANSGSNYGVWFDSSTLTTSFIFANVTGTGGGAGTGANNYGVYISGTGGITNTSNSGYLINGTGGNGSGTGGNNYGVYLTAINAIRANNTSTAVTGTGSASSGNNNAGIVIGGSTATVVNTSGTLTLSGTGGGSGNSGSNYGVWVTGGATVSGTVNALTVTGTGGGAGTGTNNHGVYVEGAGSSIKSTGAGGVIVTGTGGNAAGTGGTNQGIYTSIANAITTNAAGSITLKGIKGGQATSYGIYDDVANSVITTGTGNVTAFADTLFLNAANNINTLGILKLAPYTNIGMSVGASVASTFNLSTAQLDYISGGSYVFGSTTTGTGAVNNGDVTVNTTKDFGATNVTFFSGNDIKLGGTLTKATGAGTATYQFKANRNIFNGSSAGILASTGAIDLTLQSDFNGDGGIGAGNGGAIYLTTGTINTNGGNITMGGGSGTITGAVVNTTTGAVTTAATGYAVGNAQSQYGIKSSTLINAGGGTIIMNGTGYNSTADNIYGIHLSNAVSTSGAGGITISGKGQGITNSGHDHGIYFNNNITASGSGAIILVGIGGGAVGGTGSGSDGVVISAPVTAGSGSIYINATGGHDSSGDYGVFVDSDIITTGGNIIINSQGGTGNTNDISFRMSSGSINAGSGTITVNAAIGNAGADGLYINGGTIGGAGQTGTINLFADRAHNTTGYTIGTTGILNIANQSVSTTIGIGSGAGTLKILDSMLALYSAGSYLFGSTTSGDVTINTGNNFADANVTITSGSNIIVAGALTKATGAGTANYTFRSNAYFTINASSPIAATSGKINVLATSNNNKTVNSSITTNGGYVILAGAGNGTLGGTNGILGDGDGTGADDTSANGDGGRGVGVNINASIQTNGGDLIINGRGRNFGASGYHGVVITGAGTALQTGAGALRITGTAGGFGASNANAIQINAASVFASTGNIFLNADDYATGSTSHAINMLGSASIYTTSTGAISLKGISTSGQDLYMSTASIGQAGTTAGAITINADTVTLTSSPIVTTNALTFAPRTAVTVGLGTGAGTLALGNAALANLSAGSYIFGSTVSGDLTINTTADFADKNVTFISGNDIFLNGTLTKATGTGIANYNFLANRNISNAATMGIATSAGGMNLVLDSDYDNNGTGSISINGATGFSTGTGSIRLNDATTLLGDLTLNGRGVTLDSTVNGDTAGSRNLVVNAGIGTFTNSGIIGGTNKLNNLVVTADDVVINANLNGSGTLTLQPYSTNRTVNVNYGTADGTNWNLSTAEIARLVNGWSSILIGNTGTTSVDLNIGTSTWSDPLTFRSNSRAILLAGSTLTTTDNAPITFNVNWFNGYGSSIINSAAAVAFNTASINGFQSYGSAVNAANSNISFSKGITLNSGNLALNAGTGTIAVTNGVNGAYNFTASGNAITFGSDLGNTTALNAVTLTSATTLTLPSITAASILAQATGAAADIVIAAGKTLTASGSGNALTLVAGRNFINNSGGSALAAASGRWLVYSTTPVNNTRGGLLPDASDFNRTYAGNPPASIGAGNRFEYATATAPVLTYTTGNGSAIYGDAYSNASTTSTYSSGLISGDTLGTIGLTGTSGGTNTYVQGTTDASVTPYSGMLTATVGSLASKLGYTFAFTGGDLTVNKRTLVVSTDSQVKTLSGATPAFTGSNDLIAADAALITFVYAPMGYAGSTGTYIIAADATDPSSRLANYDRVNSYGTLTVSPDLYVPTPFMSTDMPDSVRHLSQEQPVDNFVTFGGEGYTGTIFANAENGPHLVAYNRMDGSGPAVYLPDYIQLAPSLQQEISLLAQTL